METVLVTGANRGIGLALASRFHSGGYNVIATCRNLDISSDLNVLRCKQNFSVRKLDVPDDDSISSLRDILGDQRLDILINNAGIMAGDRQGESGLDYQAWDQVLKVNTIGPFRISEVLKRNLQKSQRPRVITLSSAMGSHQSEGKGEIPYRSSKAALNKGMRVLATEYAESGIIVCPVHPGWVRTDMGGSGGMLSAKDSAQGLYKLIKQRTMAHSGRFWSWDGNEHPW